MAREKRCSRKVTYMKALTIIPSIVLALMPKHRVKMKFAISKRSGEIRGKTLHCCNTILDKPAIRRGPCVGLKKSRPANTCVEQDDTIVFRQ